MYNNLLSIFLPLKIPDIISDFFYCFKILLNEMKQNKKHEYFNTTSDHI